jgi:hypothetical protein
MPIEEQTGSRFIVDLGNVKLPPLVERQVEAEIQAIVLRELAENQLNNNASTQRKPTIWETFSGQTRGLWPTYPKNPPGISGAGGGPFTVQDHTLIMKAIMDNALQVVRRLPGKYKSKGGPRPTGTAVLKAALQVNEIDSAVKARIREMLPIGRRFEESKSNLPQGAKRALDDLQKRLARETGGGKLRLLRDPNTRNRNDGVDLTASMEIAAQMLEDGESSIYSPDHSFFRMLGRSSATARPIDDIKDADTVFGTAGGFWGTWIEPGLGTAAGAVTIGTFGSAGAAIGHIGSAIWDFITGDDDDDVDVDVHGHGHGHGHSPFDDDYPDL